MRGRNLFPVVIAIASPRAFGAHFGLLDNPLLDFPNIIAPDVKFYDRDRMVMGKGNVISFGHIFSCHVEMGGLQPVQLRFPDWP